MATQTATEYANGRVQALTFVDEDGVQVEQTYSYTIGSYDYSLVPPKPSTITNPTWWDVSHKGQESSLNPTYFADSYFKLRGYPEPTPSRPTTLGTNTLSRVVFNRIKL